MISKKYFLTVITFLFSITAIAQQSYTTTVELIKNEKWWGLLSGLGVDMPFVKPITIDLSQTSRSNQASSTMVSSMGRYVWSNHPFVVEFDDSGAVTIVSQHEKVEVQKAGKTLREAFLTVSQKHFTGSNTISHSNILSMPIVTLDELSTSTDVLDLSDMLKSKGFGATTFMFDISWQRYNGSLDFNQSQYPSHQDLISAIHSTGSKVMVSISPFVSADSPLYRELKKKGYLVLDSKTLNPKLIEWDGGVSAAYDFTNSEVVSYFIDKLKAFQTAYSIDGFDFTQGDIDYYTTNIKSFVESATAVNHVQAWGAIASNFKFSQIRSTFNSQNLPLSHQLSREKCTWKSLQSIIPNLMASNLMGYPYTSVGATILDNADDQTLLVRLIQIQAATPVMNLPQSILSLSQENINACLKATTLHSKFKNYIAELSNATEETGAPIIRTMEYEFPGKAFSDCKDQFMLGSRYLIAPILTADGKRMVRLPNGRWQDDLGVVYRGPRVISISAPLDRIPYFEYIKSESIIKKVLNRIK